MKQNEPAHFSGRLEHPTMYVFSVWGDDILKYLLDSSLFILTYVSYSPGMMRNIYAFYQKL